jgi:transposase
MTLTWYGNQTTAEACHYGPLAVIVPLLERMKVAQLIDQHIPRDPQGEFSHGKVLSLLVAARLFSPLALMNVAGWANDTGADFLWDIPVEKLNDDRLGRGLDAFFQQRHSILASVALHVAHEFDIPLKELHYDPTHILFHGAYEGAQARPGVIDGENTHSDSGLQPAHITKGRGGLDAPAGALMIHAGLCTHVDEYGPVPFFGHTVDGNQNGHTAVAEQLALIRKHLKPAALTMISDRGTFSAGHLRRLLAEGFHAICAAPWGEFQPLFDEQRDKLTWKEASFLSIEQQRRRKDNSALPHEHYQLAVLKHQLVDADSGEVIPCRVIFVFSTADQKVVRKQRQKQIDKLRKGLGKIQKSVAAGNRNSDPTSVARRLAKLFGKKDAARYFHWEMTPLSARQRAALPQPGRGSRRPTHRLDFRFDEQAVRQDETHDGFSALVSTVPANQASADELFTRLKQQNYSEHVHARFKGPLAVHPVFLHSPQRVEALVFLMMIALTLYFLLQRIYRQSVPQDASSKERRTTARTILQAFASYTLLVHHKALGREIQPTRLTTRQRELLRRLGFPTPAHLLSKRLPRPPT